MKKLLSLFLTAFILQLQSNAQGSWHTVSSPPVTSSFYGMDMSFINDSTGWFGDVYGSIFKTTDAGNHWDSISQIVTGQLRSLEFVNDTLGFVGSLSGSSTSPGSFFKTTDGGHNWAQVSNLVLDPNDGICGIEKHDSCIIAVGSINGPAWFYKSTDYGTNWTKTDMSAFASVLIDCKIINQDTILVSGAADSANQYKAIILRTTDGGISWQQVFISQYSNSYGWKIFISKKGKGLCSVQNPFAVYPITTGYTTDYGQTWQEIFVTPTSVAFSGAGVCFLNDSIGWISNEYSGLTYETQNGGTTWNINPLVEGINRFVVLDSITVIAAANNVIYKYDNSSVGIPTVSNKEKLPANSLRVLPNPSKNNIVIEATAWRNVLGRIRIIDLQGRVIKDLGKQFFNKGKNTIIQKTDLPPGNYTVIWINNDGYSSVKLSVVNE